MIINSKLTEKRLYSRNKYSDGIPLLSDDIHRDGDISQERERILINSLVGSCCLEDPSVAVLSASSTEYKARIDKIFSVNLNGDIFLAGNSTDVYPITYSKTFTGTLLMLCWYTELGSSSTLREYGCIQNSTIDNDLTDNPLHIQTSKRCQVRWSLFLSSTVFDYNNPTIRDITSSTPIYSEAGSIGFVTFSKTNQELVGNFYKVPSEETMTPSSTGYLYILPIANITNGNIVSIKTNHVGSCIVSETEPLYKNYKLWYNPSTKNIKLYLNGVWIGLNETQVFKVATKPTGSYRDGTLWYNTTTKSFSVYTATTGGFTEIMQALTETDLNSILVL